MDGLRPARGAVLPLDLIERSRASPGTELASPQHDICRSTLLPKPTLPTVWARPHPAAVPAHLRSKGWSDARAFSFTQLQKNPNAYFYRHVVPHEQQVGGVLGIFGRRLPSGSRS